MFIFATNLFQRLCPISGNKNKLPGKANFFRTVSYSAVSKEIHVLCIPIPSLLGSDWQIRVTSSDVIPGGAIMSPWDDTQSNESA